MLLVSGPCNPVCTTIIRVGKEGYNELCYTGIKGIFPRKNKPVGVQSCKLYPRVPALLIMVHDARLCCVQVTRTMRRAQHMK